MSITIFCDNCDKSTEPLADDNPKSAACYCADCAKQYKEGRVTSFFVNQLRSLGRVRSAKKEVRGFSTGCPTCKKEDKPVIRGEQAFCSHCSAELALSAPFIKLLRDQA